MDVKCINKICLHEWNYRGKSESYISCSKCGFRFKLQRAIENYVKNYVKKDNIEDNILIENPYRKTIEVPETESVKKPDEEEMIFTNPLHCNPVNIEHIKKQSKNIK